MIGFSCYVAAPYSKGVIAENVRNAVRAGDELWAAGIYPFIPHLTHLWELISPKDYEEWLRWDFFWLDKCDALLRLPGISPGANREMDRMEANGKPVFYAVKDVIRFAEPWRKAGY